MTAIERRRIMTEVEAASSEAGAGGCLRNSRRECADVSSLGRPLCRGWHGWARGSATLGPPAERGAQWRGGTICGARIYDRTFGLALGSMTLSARWAAKDEASPLTQTTRDAILKPRASKHILPVDVKRCLRASAAEVSRYRDPKSGQNDGIYTPGWLRMSTDGTRRLVPGERQVWDDGSVNVGVVVPWTRGGDKCSERWGVRVARFQLLAAIGLCW